MRNWITIADRLRAVKRAHQDYLFRAFIDRLIIGPMLLDRLAADLAAVQPRRRRIDPPMQDRTLPADDE